MVELVFAYDVVFTLASIIMWLVFGLPGAACVAVFAGTIIFSPMWWIIAIVETFIILCIEVYDIVRRGV